MLKDYLRKLTIEIGKGYTFTSLTRMKKFYLLISKLATLSQQLSFGHYVELLQINDLNQINYYISITEHYNLSNWIIVDAKVLLEVIIWIIMMKLKTSY